MFAMCCASICGRRLTTAVLQVLPQAPTELVMELSRRYMMLYETITDEIFSPTPFDIHQLRADVNASLQYMDMERAKKRSLSRQQQQ